MVGTRRRASRRGFTLLELMVAISILALGLTWLVEATMRAVQAQNHAKLVTAGTFLARQVMVDLEDELQEKGLQDDAFASEKEGTFDNVGFKRFVWRRVVDKIVLPSQSDVQSALGAATTGGGLGGLANGGGLGGTSGIGGFTGGPGLGGLGGPGGPGAGGLAGLGGAGSTPGAAASTGMFASQFGMVKDILEQGIRMVTVKVVWYENGREQTVEVKEYLTDPRRVDQAISIPALGNAQQNSPNQATQTNTTSQTNSTSQSVFR